MADGPVSSAAKQAIWRPMVDYLARDAEALSNGNNITDPDERNAIAHAHTSAEWAKDSGRGIATVVGNLKELMSTAEERKDSNKDEYNNEVGRRIAEYADRHGLPEGAIDDLVIDALNHSELVVDEETDPRSQEPGSTPTWTGPSPDWRGASKGRDYSGTMPWLPGSDGLVGELLDPSSWADPLVLDLNGDGIKVVGLEQSGAFFDLDGDGLAERTGWISGSMLVGASGGDGLLAIDRNGNGVIDGIPELVGSGFVSPGASTDRANDGPAGFAALAAFDANGDGEVGAAEAAAAGLAIWRDGDGDGETDAGELVSFDEAGVAAISLAHTDLVVDPQSALDHAGPNGAAAVVASGTFTRTDGNSGIVSDVWQPYDPGDTMIDATIDFDPDVRDLPVLFGSGEISLLATTRG